ncbi:M3 family metallopeptidase [Beijerinckia sp. L45]|uniref:M3 family metallopeptidase n=1 Tax=Beijerinckia sp. L45 TaxID=1641855 RepID=UPI00131BF3A4|nr:M3 family metallopeptidase [Beijerinckia sp. L45]
MTVNPLLQPWTGPFEAPPFAAVRPEHYRPAFDMALAENVSEIAAIADNPAAPTFDNTILAMERAGEKLDKVCSVFFNLSGSDTNDAIQAIEREMAPILSRHGSAIYLNKALFQRIDALWSRRDSLGLDGEQARVIERYHTIFSRAGGGLPDAAKTRLAAISERLATLGTQFGQNVLADERAYELVLDTPEDLVGLPASLVAAAAAAAEARGKPGKHVITLSRSSIEPFLQFSARRDLREEAFQAWAKRGENGGETDNRAIIAETVTLRAERAKLLGYESFAAFRLADSMAKTPDAARHLLHSVWEPAKARAGREASALQALASAEGDNFAIAPWDWRYYAERRRKAEFDLDEAEIKPYFQLDKMIDAAFYTAEQLFGVSFTLRPDIPLYHPDARAWEVKDADGAAIALFIGDYFARTSKRSGAWMNAFRSQQRLDGAILPIIVNVMNFAKAPEGEASLLSFDDARTLFHEFGHGLHGMLSDVTHPILSGTSVSRDFVEFPSQLYEHWFEEPALLRRFAVHKDSGAPIPEALLRRLLDARNFNQGFATVEYTASALVDLDLHSRGGDAPVDVSAFEKETLDKLGMPQGIIMRHRTPHFQHVFAGDGYSSAYYAYLWSEVLDADGFDAFTEAGDIFDPATAKRLRDHVYSAGNKADPEAAYRAFRGRDPSSEALLRKRGLVGEAA